MRPASLLINNMALAQKILKTTGLNNLIPSFKLFVLHKKTPPLELYLLKNVYCSF